MRNGSVRVGWAFWLVALAFAANAPDLDFIPGILIGEPDRFHHGPSHTLIGVVTFGLLAGAASWLAGFTQSRRFAVLMGLAYFSHLLLDLVTIETNAPYGMTLLWPFSADPVRSPVHLFLDIRRDGAAGGFLPGLWQWHNLKAVGWELLVTGAAWAAVRGAIAIGRADTRSREVSPRRPVEP